MFAVKSINFARILPIVLSVCVLIAAVPLLRFGYRRYFSANYPIHYQEYVTAAAQEFDVDPSLIYAMIHTESDFNPQATSSADAKGLMQLTDDTFEWALSRAGENGKYTPDDLYDPAVNIRYGVYVISLLREQFEYDDTILAAYNAGQGRVQAWLFVMSPDGKTLPSIPYPETAEYVRRVNDARKHYQRLYQIK